MRRVLWFYLPAVGNQRLTMFDETDADEHGLPMDNSAEFFKSVTRELVEGVLGAELPRGKAYFLVIEADGTARLWEEWKGRRAQMKWEGLLGKLGKGLQSR